MNGHGGCVSDTLLRLTTLRKRQDFLRAARSLRIVKPGFILQLRPRGASEDQGARVGFTCSKKLGNAVARNRAKRRLREIARLALGPIARPDVDYVLIGRAGVTAARPFAQLQRDLADAVAIGHRKLK